MYLWKRVWHMTNSGWRMKMRKMTLPFTHPSLYWKPWSLQNVQLLRNKTFAKGLTVQKTIFKGQQHVCACFGNSCGFKAGGCLVTWETSLIFFHCKKYYHIKCLIADNRPEWVFCELTVWCQGIIKRFQIPSCCFSSRFASLFSQCFLA